MLVLVLLLSSCTINHPLYTSNYRIEWKNFKHNRKHIFSNNNSQNKINSESIATKAVVHEQADTSLTQNRHISYNNTASTDRSILVLPAKKFDFKTTKASTKKTNTAFYSKKIKAKIDEKKLSLLKRKYYKIHKTKPEVKALYIFILVLALTGLALAFLSLFGSYFLFSMIAGGVILLTLGILIILGT